MKRIEEVRCGPKGLNPVWRMFGKTEFPMSFERREEHGCVAPIGRAADS